MNKRLSILLVAASLAASSVTVQAEKDHPAWQTGTVLDMGRQEAEGFVFESYEIDAGTAVYLSREKLKWRWSNEANLTVNKSVRFYVDKEKLYILDDDGKKHETEIMKKTLKMVPLPTHTSGEYLDPLRSSRNPSSNTLLSESNPAGYYFSENSR